MPELDDLRDLRQAAAELRLAPGRLRIAIKRGTFAARKVGGAWITTTQEIERYREDAAQLDEPELTSMAAVGDDGQVFGG